MTAQIVLHWPDPRLKNIAKTIDDILDESTLELAISLKDTMRVELGAGLAATQIGDSRSMVVIDGSYSSSATLEIDPNVKDVIVLINPQVQPINDKMFEWQEACLSVPNYSNTVKRHSDINLIYSDTAGMRHSKNLSPPFSGIVQHEIDHLSGVLYLDRLSKTKKRLAEATLRSRIKKKSKDLQKARSKERKSTRSEPAVRNGFRTKPTRIRMTSKKKKSRKK